MSIIVSKEARKDLVQIRQYISEELCNPDAAVRIMGLLKKSIASLSDFPGRGRPLDALIPVPQTIDTWYAKITVCLISAMTAM